MTRQEYDSFVERAERIGYKVLTRYRANVKRLRLSGRVLTVD